MCSLLLHTLLQVTAPSPQTTLQWGCLMQRPLQVRTIFPQLQGWAHPARVSARTRLWDRVQGRLRPLPVPVRTQHLWVGMQQQGRLPLLLVPGWTQYLWLGWQQQGRLLPLLPAACSLPLLHPPLLGGARVSVGPPAQARLPWTHARCSCRPSLHRRPQQVGCCDAHAECTWVTALCRGLETPILSPPARCCRSGNPSRVFDADAVYAQRLTVPAAGLPAPLAPPQPKPQPIAQLPTPFAQASLQPQLQQQLQPAGEAADEDLLPSPRPISDLPVSAAAAVPVLAQILEHDSGHSSGLRLAGTSDMDSAAEGTDVPMTPAPSPEAEATDVSLTPAPSPEANWGRPAGRRGGLCSHRLSEDDWRRRRAEPSAQQAPTSLSEVAASSTKVCTQA